MWVEGLTTKPDVQSDPQNYETRQKQRYMERNVRKWKRREVAAMTDDEAKKAKNYIRKWQGKLREFTDETDRYRKYERESIKTAR